MRALRAIALISCVVVLAGCVGAPVMTTTSTQTNPGQGAAFSGGVHGGQQPIVGASVYLYAVDATGYGKASDSLLKSPGYVATDGSGNFLISGDYTCPSASTQVYLYAVGGNPGLALGTNNSAAGLLAGLGSCGSLNSNTVVDVNEVSTIVTAFALAGFATDATHVSSSGSALALTGVANAFSTISNMETLKTGVALAKTPSGYGNVPLNEINTLADILAACINSTGPGSAGCTTLLSNAKNGSTTPTDTATAAINIAHNPGANVAALYGLQTPTSPFQPDLSPQPSDFTMQIGFSSPNGWGFYTDLAIDGSGNVWVVGGFGTSGDGVGELLANTLAWSSTTPMTSGGLAAGSPANLAIDPSENVWITTNNAPATLVELSSSGTVLSGSGGYSNPTTSGLFGDLGPLAINGSGTVFLPTGYSNFWEYVPATGYNGWWSQGGVSHPVAVAVDASGDIWLPNGNVETLAEYSSSLTPITPSAGYTGAGQNDTQTVAIDASGNVWLGNYYASLSEYSSSGAPVSTSSGYTGGGLGHVSDLAIDGADNVWAVNEGGGGTDIDISEFSSSGTAITGASGYAGANLGGPNAIAIDGSGNVWVTDPGSGPSYFVEEFVGLAAPVVTPEPANLKTPYGAHAVNLP